MRHVKNIRRNLIFVDDIKFSLMSVKNRLKRHYEIHTAESVAEMFEIIDSVKPELILLDINMPEIDGFEAIKRLKANAAYAAIPVVFLTATTERANVVKGIKLGAADIVKKPFSDLELVESIEYILDPEKRRTIKPIILVVDDDPDVSKSINHLLSDRYRVYTLSEPEKLKKLLTIITPDLFLLDCNMPKLSGFDLVPVIRAMHGYEETDIIFITAEGTINQISTAIRFGACDFIVKPINEEILREKAALHTVDFLVKRHMRSFDAK